MNKSLFVRMAGALIVIAALLLGFTPAASAAMPAAPVQAAATSVSVPMAVEFDDPGGEKLTSVCSSPDASASASSKLPVNRWSDATSSLHSRLDNSWGGDIGLMLQRDWVLSGGMVAGNTMWSLGTGLSAFAINFCILGTMGGYADQIFAKIGDTFLSSPIVMVLVLATLLAVIFRGRKSGQIAWKTIAMKAVIVGLLGVMLVGAGQSTGGGATPAGGGEASKYGYVPGVMSPGWIVSKMNSTISNLASGPAYALSVQQGDNIASKQNRLGCDHYTQSLKNSYTAQYGEGSAKLASAVPMLLSGMWEQTGLKTWRTAQFGGGNLDENTWCRLLEWNSLDRIKIVDKDKDDTAYGSSVRNTMLEVLSGGGKDSKAGNLAMGEDDPQWRAPAFDIATDDRVDTDRSLVAWSVCRLKDNVANLEAASWDINPIWLTGDSKAKDKYTPQDCSNWFSRDNANTKAFNWDGNSDHVRERTVSGPVVGLEGTPVEIDKENARQVRAYMMNLHGHTNTQATTSIITYVVSALSMLIVFGLISLAIIIAKVAMIVMIVTLSFVLITALMPNSGLEKFGAWLKTLLGMNVYVFGVQLIFALVSIFTYMLSTMGASFLGDTNLISTIWTGFSPLISVFLIHMVFTKVLKVPSPFSVSGGMAWGAAAGTAGGAAFAGVSSMLNRQQSRASNRAKSAARGGSRALLNKASGGRLAGAPGTTRKGAATPDEGKKDKASAQDTPADLAKGKRKGSATPGKEGADSSGSKDGIDGAEKTAPGDATEVSATTNKEPREGEATGLEGKTAESSEEKQAEDSGEAVEGGASEVLSSGRGPGTGTTADSDSGESNIESSDMQTLGSAHRGEGDGNEEEANGNEEEANEEGDGAQPAQAVADQGAEPSEAAPTATEADQGAEPSEAAPTATEADQAAAKLTKREKLERKARGLTSEDLASAGIRNSQLTAGKMGAKERRTLSAAGKIEKADARTFARTQRMESGELGTYSGDVSDVYKDARASGMSKKDARRKAMAKAIGATDGAGAKAAGAYRNSMKKSDGQNNAWRAAKAVSSSTFNGVKAMHPRTKERLSNKLSAIGEGFHQNPIKKSMKYVAVTTAVVAVAPFGLGAAAVAAPAAAAFTAYKAVKGAKHIKNRKKVTDTHVDNYRAHQRAVRAAEARAALAQQEADNKAQKAAPKVTPTVAGDANKNGVPAGGPVKLQRMSGDDIIGGSPARKESSNQPISNPAGAIISTAVSATRRGGTRSSGQVDSSATPRSALGGQTATYDADGIPYPDEEPRDEPPYDGGYGGGIDPQPAPGNNGGGTAAPAPAPAPQQQPDSRPAPASTGRRAAPARNAGPSSVLSAGPTERIEVTHAGSAGGTIPRRVAPVEVLGDNQSAPQTPAGSASGLPTVPGSVPADGAPQRPSANVAPTNGQAGPAAPRQSTPVAAPVRTPAPVNSAPQRPSANVAPTNAGPAGPAAGGSRTAPAAAPRPATPVAAPVRTPAPMNSAPQRTPETPRQAPQEPAKRPVQNQQPVGETRRSRRANVAPEATPRPPMGAEAPRLSASSPEQRPSGRRVR